MERFSPRKERRDSLIVIVGPTASGKSDLGVQLARKFGGEVVSADSRQVYRGLDIGSGKITKKEMMGIPHHLLDVASPRRRFSAAQYQKLAFRAIRDIQRRGKLPILVGGTPFYVYSVVDGSKRGPFRLNHSASGLPSNLNPRKLRPVQTEESYTFSYPPP